MLQVSFELGNPGFVGVDDTLVDAVALFEGLFHDLHALFQGVYLRLPCFPQLCQFKVQSIKEVKKERY